MKVVYAYYHNREKPGAIDEAKDKEAQRLVDRKFKSFNAVLDAMKEGEHATVEVPGRGYKTVNIEKGQRYIQRNYAPEW